MSRKDEARRAACEVFFDGVDITQALRPYLRALTFTDSEEDETDDLQIDIEDRDGIWLTQWLAKAAQSAVSERSAEQNEKSGEIYTVSADTALNVRSGPGMSNGVINWLAHGDEVSVQSIENGWAKISLNGQEAYVSAAYITPKDAEAGDDKQDESGNASKGLRISASILRENYESDGMDIMLDCGFFELDSISVSGPPSEISIKATSIPYVTQIRQEKKSQAWEGYNLSGIAEEIAGRGGMGCMFESANNPYYERVEQITQSDISFLQQLCHEAGISLKSTNNILVLFDQKEYEQKDPILTIRRGDGTYDNYRLESGQANSLYTSCRVYYTRPDGTIIEGTATAESSDSDADTEQKLEIYAQAESADQAKQLAENYLRLYNKFECTASFSMAGTPEAMSGLTVELRDFGMWDGKYIISSAQHRVDKSGYTTDIDLRRVLKS